ncbi:DUF2218 domain-containing protein [Mesorhizobium sp. 10J20-29]
MPRSTAHLSTPRASGYLQQLCKHFGHKVPVDFTPEAGEVTLPSGTCALRVESEVLTLDVVGEAENLEKLEKVIGDHLVRFAFRENITLTWHRLPEPV